MPYECVSADGNLAAILVTNLETGDSLPACPDCMSTILLSLVESATGQTFGPVGEPVPDLETDDETDEDEAMPASPQTPPGADSPPEVAPGGPDETAEEWEDDHDQLAEDQAVYAADLAAGLGHRVSG